MEVEIGSPCNDMIHGLEHILSQRETKIPKYFLSTGGSYGDG